VIRTVHGFGYAFAGEAVEDARAPARTVFACRLVWGTREIGLAEGENVIGRAEGSAVRIDSPRVSRRHARIVVSGGAGSIEDLGSKNGTFVKGQRITAPYRLADGDQIRLGSVVITFRIPPIAGSTESVQSR
jgi:pSer/pThr/pTyr-binding forkhead associated (FHA) protein